jgi:hypothetical protein
MIPQAKEIEALATKYSKPQLQQMAQMGQIDPATAVMAGMMIDRIVQSNIQPPQSTVAQDVMAPPAAQGLAAIPAGGMAPPPMDPSMATQMPAAGLEALPVPDTMFNEDSFAGGGIVAFSPGGFNSGSTFDVEDYMPTDQGPAVKGRVEVPEELIGKIGLSQVLDIQEGRYGTDKQDILTSFGVKKPVAPPPSPFKPAGSVTPAKDAPFAGNKTSTTQATPERNPYQEFQDMLKAAGVSNDPYAEERAANAAALQGLAKERERAKYLNMLMGSLKTMAGTSPDAIKNIAEGLEAGVTGYEKSAREIKADEREISKTNRDLRRADEARKRGDVEKAYEIEKDLRDYKLRKEGLEIQREKARSDRSGSTKLNELRKNLELVENRLLGLTKKDPDYAFYSNLKRQYEAALFGAGGGGSGRTLNWNDIPTPNK